MDLEALLTALICEDLILFVCVYRRYEETAYLVNNGNEPCLEHNESCVNAPEMSFSQRMQRKQILLLPLFP